MARQQIPRYRAWSGKERAETKKLFDCLKRKAHSKSRLTRHPHKPLWNSSPLPEPAGFVSVLQASPVFRKLSLYYHLRRHSKGLGKENPFGFPLHPIPPWRGAGIEPAPRQRTVSPVHHSQGAWRYASPPCTRTLHEQAPAQPAPPLTPGWMRRKPNPRFNRGYCKAE